MTMYEAYVDFAKFLQACLWLFQRLVDSTRHLPLAPLAICFGARQLLGAKNKETVSRNFGLWALLQLLEAD